MDLSECVSDSNQIDESDSKDDKSDEPRVRTFCGILIDRTDEDEMLLI
jgi:hypothetical protein